MDNLKDIDFNKKIDERILKVVPNYLQKSAFSTRKLTDTPTDAFMLVSRKYVNLNGPSSTRPTSSIVGQFYYDTSINRPIWWNGTNFTDAAGNVV